MYNTINSKYNEFTDFVNIPDICLVKNQPKSFYQIKKDMELPLQISRKASFYGTNRVFSNTNGHCSRLNIKGFRLA